MQDEIPVHFREPCACIFTHLVISSKHLSFWELTGWTWKNPTLTQGERAHETTHRQWPEIKIDQRPWSCGGYIAACCATVLPLTSNWDELMPIVQNCTSDSVRLSTEEVNVSSTVDLAQYVLQLSWCVISKWNPKKSQLSWSLVFFFFPDFYYLRIIGQEVPPH